MVQTKLDFAPFPSCLVNRLKYLLIVLSCIYSFKTKENNQQKALQMLKGIQTGQLRFLYQKGPSVVIIII